MTACELSKYIQRKKERGGVQIAASVLLIIEQIYLPVPSVFLMDLRSCCRE